MIHSARGVGTFCAISGHTADIRDNLVSELRNNGMAQQVIVGYCVANHVVYVIMCR